MGASQKQKDRILARETHNERVKESFKVAKEIVTDPINDLIVSDYAKIDKTIDELDKTSKDYPVLVQALKMLKHEVPRNYAIHKDYVSRIQDEINLILGQNTSNNI